MAAEVLEHLTDYFVRVATPPPRLTLRAFAENRIVIPEGQFKGLRFRCDTLPWSGVLFDEIDSGRWTRFVVTGCVQGGKTLCSYVIPTCWHLFEHAETVVAGVPQMSTAYDKWRTELKPTIDQSPELARWLPTTGKGSKGGQFEAIRFTQGAELRFMSGGGGDEKRSHYTTRVAVVTEADRLDTAGESSREAAPIQQIEARTKSYGDDARFYAECTTTTVDGYVNRERESGTDSALVKPCPHCREHVAPERENFRGWEDAGSADEAALLGRFHCPACDGELDDDQRRQMCLGTRIVHRGQTIDADGTLRGEAPQTRTLGFRFSAFDNLLWGSGFIARNCWEAQHDRDQESAELALRQWMWVQPAEPELKELAPLTLEDVLDKRLDVLPRGTAPAWAELVTCAADLRATQLHYVLLAWTRDGFGHLVDCGVIPVDREKWGVEKGLKLAQRLLRDRLAQQVPTADGRSLPVGWTPMDAGWKTDIVRQFVRECRQQDVRIFLPSFGRGAAAGLKMGQYRHPTAVSERTPEVGDQYYLAWHDKHALHALFVNADHWKTMLRERLATPADQPGAITVFDPLTETDHQLLRQFARHVTAERPVERVQTGRGPVTVWENASRAPNHWLDCAYMATAAGHLYGVRVLEDAAQPEGPRGRLLPPITGPDGEPISFELRRAG